MFFWQISISKKVGLIQNYFFKLCMRAILSADIVLIFSKTGIWCELSTSAHLTICLDNRPISQLYTVQIFFLRYACTQGRPSLPFSHIKKLIFRYCFAPLYICTFCLMLFVCGINFN